MSLHVFANFVTPYGVASNNRGETEGNTTTLQKLLWCGETHTSVSAESIRFALRRNLYNARPEELNRYWDDGSRSNEWRDRTFDLWAKGGSESYLDDDLLGFMATEAASQEAEGSATVRRGILEIARAVSLTPWTGDTSFNTASIGATPSAQKKGANPVPYSAEIHATRYQYGIALTPARLRKPERAAIALRALASLRTVAGNHSRFLFDFSPEAVVYRVTDDPAPRILYCFGTDDYGKSLQGDSLLARVASGAVVPGELVLGVDDLASPLAKSFQAVGVPVFGVKAATEAACAKIAELSQGGK